MLIEGYLLLIVAGALLRWAVTYRFAEFDIQAAGLIIMIVAIVGLIISLLFWFDRRNYTPPWRRTGDVCPSTEYHTRERVIREYVPPPLDEPLSRPEDGRGRNAAAEDDTLPWDDSQQRRRTHPRGE